MKHWSQMTCVNTHQAQEQRSDNPAHRASELPKAEGEQGNFFSTSAVNVNTTAGQVWARGEECDKCHN
jgi:hypothetical protein